MGEPRIPTSVEPRRRDAAAIELLDRVAARVHPDDAALAAWAQNYARQHRGRLATDLWALQNWVPAGQRVLEYGAVPLLMTGAMAELDYEVCALDLEPDRFGTVIRDLALDVRRCDVEREPVPFADATFDAILFNELFEHLRIDPIFTMREALRVLAPGGVLLLSTPNLRSLRGLRNLILRDQAHAASADVYRQYEKLETLGHMGHVREYTTREVREFLTRVGFRVEHVMYRGGFGRGVVGALERLLPRWRPFFTLVARREDR